MNMSMKSVAALASVVTLAACVANNGVKPTATASDQSQACVSHIGSRIPANGANCSSTARSYSGEDIDRTGQTNAGDALRLMDPAITVHH
jgi:uncharacterized lipoprotein